MSGLFCCLKMNIFGIFKLYRSFLIEISSLKLLISRVNSIKIQIFRVGVSWNVCFLIW